jgi:hypothetical protein
MENTYWNRKGNYENLVAELNKLVPDMGEIAGSKNRKLEKFRKASNAYYDIFNNGGCNRGAQIRGIFGFGMTTMSEVVWGEHGKYRKYHWDAIHAIVEPIMDKIILAAAKEQDIRDWDAEAAQNDYEKEFA